MMVDYFLRNGFSKTAETITKQAGIEVKLTNSMLPILLFFVGSCRPRIICPVQENRRRFAKKELYRMFAMV